MYLLSVEGAGVSLDGDELLAADGETVGESVGGVGEGRGQAVDVLLGELEIAVRFGLFHILVTRLNPAFCIRDFGIGEVQSYLESSGLSLQTGEVSGQDTGLVELTGAHQAVELSAF